MKLLSLLTALARLALAGSLLATAAFAAPASPAPATESAEGKAPFTLPFTPGKVLVILGSSNGAGIGSSSAHGDPKGPEWSSPPTSWAGLLTAQLTARGWTVYNRSISGSYTAVSLQRFFKDIPPLHPRAVLFCTSLENEPGWNTDATTPAVAQAYLAHLKTLIELCRGLGAAPLVASLYPKNTNDPFSWSVMQKLIAETDDLDAPVFDFLSPTVDPSTPGHFLPGISSDVAHANDVGHAAYASSIDPAVIENATIAPREAPPLGQNYWSVSGNEVPAPVVIETSACPAPSWTVHVLVKGAIPAGRIFLGVADSCNVEPLSVGTTAAGAFALIAPDGKVLAASSGPTVDPAEHELALTYNHLTTTAMFYLDGARVGSARIVLPPARFFFCGGKANVAANAENASFRSFAAWRVPFLASDIAAMHASKKLLNRSLIARPNFDVTPASPAVYVDARYWRQTAAPAAGSGR